MSFFVGKNEDVMDAAMDPDVLMRVAPEYYGPRFDAIADLRKTDDGTGYKGQEFRRVASFVNIPMFQKASILFQPDFLKDKKKFYAFLDRNREYCTYDRRWQGGEQVKQGTPEPMNLRKMGLDYEGGPETAEGWDPVEVEIPLVADVVKTVEPA